MASAATIMAKWDGRFLQPLQPVDAEILSHQQPGAIFRLSHAARRSNPQNRLYWAILGRAVEATGRWPNAEVLHRVMLIELGYCTTARSVDGKSWVLQPDSTAFAAMRGDTFKGYFDRAIELLAEHTGIDPLALVQEAA
jgi:hypothetical protein